MDYNEYKKRLAMRNIAFNFTHNTKSLLEKATPYFKQIEQNLTANADAMVGAHQSDNDEYSQLLKEKQQLKNEISELKGHIKNIDGEMNAR